LPVPVAGGSVYACRRLFFTRTPGGDTGMGTSTFESHIAHLPAAECKRLPGMLDALITARNKAAAASNKVAAAMKREGANCDGTLNAALLEQDSALVELRAARTMGAPLCPTPERWHYVREITSAPGAAPPGEENQTIVGETAAFRDFVANRKAARKRTAPPLTGREQEVFDLIAAQPP